MVPTDTNSPESVMEFAIQQTLGLLDTVKPCQVQAVTPGSGGAAGTVDVQLLISQVDGAGNATPQGIVHGIPYFRLHAGVWEIQADPAVGDFGIIVCSDRDISALKTATASGGSPMVNPGSNRRMNASDGFFIGGFLNKLPKATLSLKSDGTIAVTDAKGNVIQTAAGIALTPANGILMVNGQIQATGEITSGFGGASVTLGGHMHAQANDSAGDVEEPTMKPTTGT